MSNFIKIISGEIIEGLGYTKWFSCCKIVAIEKWELKIAKDGVYDKNTSGFTLNSIIIRCEVLAVCTYCAEGVSTLINIINCYVTF